jgi:hypothetical protein
MDDLETWHGAMEWHIDVPQRMRDSIGRICVSVTILPIALLLVLRAP